MRRADIAEILAAKAQRGLQRTEFPLSASQSFNFFANLACAMPILASSTRLLLIINALALKTWGMPFTSSIPGRLESSTSASSEQDQIDAAQSLSLPCALT